MSIHCRLVFNVAPEQREVLSRVWSESLQQLARGHGLIDGQPCNRVLPPGVVAHIYALETVGLIALIRHALAKDAQWQRALNRVDASAPDSAAENWRLELFSAAVEVDPPKRVAPGIRQGRWLSLDVHDGLPSVLVSQIAGDGKGNLLLATYEGICAYDGAHVRLTCLPEGAGQVVLEPAIGTSRGMWLTTMSGQLQHYDGEQVEIYTSADGLAEDLVGALCMAADGCLWIAGMSGTCSVFSAGRFRQVDLETPRGARPTCLHAGASGRLIVGTVAGLYAHRDGQTELLGLAEHAIQAICADPVGDLCIATDRGLYRVGPDGVTREDLPEKLSPVTGISADSRGTIWLGMARQGVIEWDGQTLRHHTTDQGLASNEVRAMHQDTRGCLWVGTWGGGLSRLDTCWIETVSSAEGLGLSRVETLCQAADGSLVIGTWGAGPMLWRDGLLCPHPQTPEIPGNGAEFIWSSLVDRDGHLWLGTLGAGATCWDGVTLRSYRKEQGLGHDSVFDMHQDRLGRMWFATQGGGLSCLDGDRMTTYDTQDGLPADHVWTVTEDHAGQIWCSTLNSGASCFDGKRFVTYTTVDGLVHDQVWCALCDRDGVMWFGTWGGGVSRFDGKDFTNFTTRDGLAHNSVRHICQSADGHIWFATHGGGVTRFDGEVFQTFSRRDGLVHDAVQHVLQATDGRMWIAAEAGVTCYAPPGSPPTVSITGVVADRRYAGAGPVVLSESQRLVAFEFEGASFSTPSERLVYVYRVRGLQDDWQRTTQRRVELRDLSVGVYTFEVRAVDRDLNYSIAQSLRVTIEPDLGQDRLAALRAELAVNEGLDQFIGQSSSLRRVLDEIDIVAVADLTVLIEGETGTGKGLAAHVIHSLSRRCHGPFIQVNCGAIPAGLVESELFGHEKGAFTGATSRRIGRFELAEGGTLFLDEIGDLPAESQRALLNVLQDGVFQRVGSGHSLRAKVRVITATNRDLRQATRQGSFREDLYFRLSPYVLHLPPLRERREDVPLLMEHFVEQFSRHLNREVPAIEPQAMTRLQDYDWPGNVRELEHLSQRATLVCKDRTIRMGDLPVLVGARVEQEASPRPTAKSLAEFEAAATGQERAFLLQALESTNWVIYGDRGAARRLGIHPEKLRRRLRNLDLRRPGSRS